MTTHFIAAEINLEENPVTLPQKIETELSKHGEPLRWAITKVDRQQQVAQIEAIVTTEEV